METAEFRLTDSFCNSIFFAKNIYSASARGFYPTKKVGYIITPKYQFVNRLAYIKKRRFFRRSFVFIFRLSRRHIERQMSYVRKG